VNGSQLGEHAPLRRGDGLNAPGRAAGRIGQPTELLLEHDDHLVGGRCVRLDASLGRRRNRQQRADR
jgi:hypothetical protein